MQYIHLTEAGLEPAIFGCHPLIRSPTPYPLGHTVLHLYFTCLNAIEILILKIFYVSLQLAYWFLY